MACHCAARAERDCIVEDAIHAVLSTVDMAVVLERTARLLRRHFGATRVAIHRIAADDPQAVELLLSDDPHGTAPARATRTPIGTSVCAVALRERRAVIVEKLGAGPSSYHEEAELRAAGYGALACFPLLFEEQALGALTIAHEPEHGLLDDCFRYAEQMARLVGIALHNSLMVEQVRQLNERLDRENAKLRDEIEQVRGDRRYVAESPLMREVVARVRMVAASDATVLIRGDTGTGKEGLARMVHELSHRAAGPFVAVNLAAIPETLIEGELYGHERGAFTGATRRKIGRFESAAGGTIFLDEVGDAPPSVQVRLLRTLQEREVQRVGGGESVAVDVRVVAATNRPLERMMDEGTFRSDLYYRLNIFPIQLPPLRERREDIRPLGAAFLERHASSMHRKPPRVPDSAWRVLEAYDWPGNVRELDNFLARALIMSPGRELELPPLPVARPPHWSAAPSPPATSPRPFDRAVRELLEQALAASGGRIHGPAGAAALLGLKPTTLQGKLRRYRIARPTRSR